MTPPPIHLIIFTSTAGILASYWLLRRRFSTSVGGIQMLAAIVMIWLILFTTFQFKASWFSVQAFRAVSFFFLSTAATTQLLFAFSYSQKSHWLTPFAYAVLTVQPLATQILFWTPPLQDRFFSGGGYGLWGQINLLYVFFILGLSLFLLIDIFMHKPTLHLIRAGSLLIGAVLPLLSVMLAFVLPEDLNTLVYFSLFSYSLAIPCFSYGKLNSSLVETTPVTRDMAVEGMDDGWMVVDSRDNVIDVNASVEKITGMSRKSLYGLPVEQILAEWPMVVQSSSEAVKEMEIRRTSKSRVERQYLNVRISRLSDRNNSWFGHLIIWRDITGRRLNDEVHQRIRDELFVLLNAISSMASRTVNLEDFLSEANFQILYSFQSQSIASFLIEDKGEGKPSLSLKSQFGFSPEHGASLEGKLTSNNIQAWLTANEENRPLLIESDSTDFGKPMIPKRFGLTCLVLIPLIIYTQHENNVLGCLCLGRSEQKSYTQDELLRLTTIANQIASLIESNRKRQLAIVMSERQRLLRDLHDSVSQKLYGLVAITEAAQATIEAGAKISSTEVLGRIGENARQAVKEMRLFLYEMQPLDMKDGLVSSIQHRLASVEGRADIKARMVSDDHIQLAKDHELALYFIAMESLNNILRHAQAKNVHVNLKQTRQKVILEIKDDGLGFNKGKIDNSGLGLRNMKERAVQANGKLTITSKEGDGTRVVVSVPRKEI